MKAVESLIWIALIWVFVVATEAFITHKDKLKQGQSCLIKTEVDSDDYTIICSDAVKTCKRVDNKLICTIEPTLNSGETQ